MEQTPQTNQVKSVSILSFFKPNQHIFISPIILNINIIVFVGMCLYFQTYMGFDGQQLVMCGGDFKPAVEAGEWWRMITAMFLHLNVLHILFNMMAFISIGYFLESLIGNWKYLAIYIACGIASSVASLLWHEYTVSVGASGAIFGLYGYFLGLLLRKSFPKSFNSSFMGSTFIFIVFNLFSGIEGNVDNAGHIGGLIFGLIVGLIMSKQVREKVNKMIEMAKANNVENPQTAPKRRQYFE